MSRKRTVAILIGNLQKASPNRKLAHALIELTSPALNFKIVEIGNMPLYNQDLDDHPPSEWQRFRTEMRRASAVLFVTPEHLGSVPAVLMNALDVGSMPKDKNVWENMPAAIAGVSIDTIGAYTGHRHLREALSPLKVLVLSEPDFYLAGTEFLFDKAEKLNDAGIKDLSAKFLASFESWIQEKLP